MNKSIFMVLKAEPWDLATKRYDIVGVFNSIGAVQYDFFKKLYRDASDTTKWLKIDAESEWAKDLSYVMQTWAVEDRPMNAFGGDKTQFQIVLVNVLNTGEDEYK